MLWGGRSAWLGAGGREERGPAGCLRASRVRLLLRNAWLLTGEDKEESRTKAVPTVAMAVSEPPSLIPPHRLCFGAAAEAACFWLRTSPWALVLLSPQRVLGGEHVSERAASRPCTHLHTRAHTLITRTHPVQRRLGRCLSPRGCPVVSCSSSLPSPSRQVN